jgi:uncharacterized membrane protein YdjX (TVP38/TMEM64 family)
MRLRSRLVWLVIVLAGLAGLTIAWRWTPLSAWLEIDQVVARLQRLGSSYGPVAAICSFAIAVSAAVPLTFLTLVTVVVFGSGPGFFYSVLCALLGASVSYSLGRVLGHEVVQRLAGERVNRLSRRLANRGVLAVVFVRIIPIAPFAIVNMIGGASHLSLRDMLTGTVIGMLPSTLAIAFFADQLISAIRHPSCLTYALVALTVTLIAFGAWVLHRILARGE